MADEAVASVRRPCDQCPWRLENHGKRSPGSFYTKANLRRLWNQVRKGGGVQSCHLTDPSHPDHVAAGARPGSTAQECAGSVVLVLREVADMATTDNEVNKQSVSDYLSRRKRGLTKTGILYWLVSRIQLGGTPFIGGPKAPSVDVDDPAVGLPVELRKG